MNSILNVNWISKGKDGEGYFHSVHGMASKAMLCHTHGIASSSMTKFRAVVPNLGCTRESLKGELKKSQYRPVNSG